MILFENLHPLLQDDSGIEHPGLVALVVDVILTVFCHLEVCWTTGAALGRKPFPMVHPLDHRYSLEAETFPDGPSVGPPVQPWGGNTRCKPLIYIIQESANRFADSIKSYFVAGEGHLPAHTIISIHPIKYPLRSPVGRSIQSQKVRPICPVRQLVAYVTTRSEDSR